MRVLAIDPGETCGVALVESDPSPYILAVDTCEPATAVAWVGAGYADIVVIEAFRLYPWMARMLGFSNLRTVEVIGQLKAKAAEVGVLVEEQPATDKRPGRDYAVSLGLGMRDRKLGKGKFAYTGPDFAYPGPQHHRDALAHAFAFLAKA